MANLRAGRAIPRPRWVHRAVQEKFPSGLALSVLKPRAATLAVAVGPASDRATSSAPTRNALTALRSPIAPRPSGWNTPITAGGACLVERDRTSARFQSRKLRSLYLPRIPTERLGSVGGYNFHGPGRTGFLAGKRGWKCVAPSSWIGLRNPFDVTLSERRTS